MGVVVSRYIDIFSTPTVLPLFWQQHPYFFVHFKNVFSVFYNKNDLCRNVEVYSYI